jgi:mono/diheme cytochrome c family protein
MKTALLAASLSVLLAVLFVPLLGLAASAALAQADTIPQAGSRGALLYDTHCIGCHTTQMHWRDNKVATDWGSLMAQVRRWQGINSLGWTDNDIDAVAEHLNQSIYRFKRPVIPA